MFYFVLFDSEKLFIIRFVICFILSSPPVMCPFMLWFLGFILSCAVASRSPSGVSYVLYCHVHLMLYLIPRVLCFTLHCLFGLLSSSYVSLCVIMSYPSGICYFIPCNIFSDFSVHPLTCRVDSTKRAKCTITICTKSDVVIRYAHPQPPNPRNIRQFQLETMIRWTHDESMKNQMEKSQRPLSRCFNMLFSVFIY